MRVLTKTPSIETSEATRNDPNKQMGLSELIIRIALFSSRYTSAGPVIQLAGEVELGIESDRRLIFCQPFHSFSFSATANGREM